MTRNGYAYARQGKQTGQRPDCVCHIHIRVIYIGDLTETRSSRLFCQLILSIQDPCNTKLGETRHQIFT